VPASLQSRDQDDATHVTPRYPVTSRQPRTRSNEPLHPTYRSLRRMHCGLLRAQQFDSPSHIVSRALSPKRTFRGITSGVNAGPCGKESTSQQARLAASLQPIEALKQLLSSASSGSAESVFPFFGSPLLTGRLHDIGAESSRRTECASLASQLVHAHQANICSLD
jgi:hypothetical protein